MTDFESKVALAVVTAILQILLTKSTNYLSRWTNNEGRRPRYSVWMPKIKPQKENLHSWIRSKFQSYKNKSEDSMMFNQAKVFFWNDGKLPVASDDLFMKKPLTLQFDPETSIGRMVILESTNAIGVRLSDEKFNNKNKNKKIISFDRIEPGHGFVVSIQFGEKCSSAIPRISGPIKDSVPIEYMGPIWAIDLCNQAEIKEQKNSARLWQRITGVFCLVGIVGQFLPLSGKAPFQAQNWTYWLFFTMFSISWMAFLINGNVCQQFKKRIPSSLHYWDDERI